MMLAGAGDGWGSPAVSVAAAGGWAHRAVMGAACWGGGARAGGGVPSPHSPCLHLSPLCVQASSPSAPDGPQVTEDAKEAFKATLPVYRQ